MNEATTKPGQRVTYISMGGDRRTITVEYSYDDIKNGRPGFEGTDAQGNIWWGYDDQIVGR